MAHNTLVLFGGAHCASCKKMSAMLNTHGVQFKYYGIEEYPTKASLYNVSSLPTLIVLGADGTPKHSKVGLVDVRTVKRLLYA